VVHVDQDAAGVTAIDSQGRKHSGAALIAADGVKSTVRQQYVNDPVRVSGHVVYRAVADAHDFPEDLKLNAPCLWAGPDCHLVHYPLRGGEQYNVVVTFHSRNAEEWGVTDGSRDEVLGYFAGIGPRPRRLLDMPKSWRRWATADREPIAKWSFGRVTLLGDAAHAMEPFQAQGAAQAVEDAFVLAECLAGDDDVVDALRRYEQIRMDRAEELQDSSSTAANVFYLPDGEEQRRRDARYATLLEELPFGTRQPIWEYDVRDAVAHARPAR
jgi:salicylate hydroxylase